MAIENCHLIVSFCNSGPVPKVMSVVEEGFICPYCLVGFATSGKLQSHFVEMHSSSETTLGFDGGEDGHQVGAAAGYEQLGNEVNVHFWRTQVLAGGLSCGGGTPHLCHQTCVGTVCQAAGGAV